MNRKADIGLIGLAVMGQNLVLNISDNNYTVAVYNRTFSTTEDFINGPANGRDNIIATRTIEEFISSLAAPRKIMLMVKAGPAVDAVIGTVLPHLSEGDIIIDGGNSFYKDTKRRTDELNKQGILFSGTGISGGEEGARFGPSIMPGGNTEAWPHLKDIFTSIAAKTDDGTPCCDWIGEDGAGHYVKMVHNGIEYGDMQIISEAYDMMRKGLNLDYGKLHETFTKWNSTELDSYLIEITADIMKFRDEDGEILVEKIRDAAKQKDTGKWTTISANDLNTPVTLISEAVFARFLSSLKDVRTKASELLPGPKQKFEGSADETVEDIRKALLAAKLISYTQGFMLMKSAAGEYGWKLDYGKIALIWRSGCIIKSVFLQHIFNAYQENEKLENLLFDSYFTDIMKQTEGALRRIVAQAAIAGIPLPAMSSALAFYDGLRSKALPANLVQAQRDYFGAHLYERSDRPEGELFHTQWIK